MLSFLWEQSLLLLLKFEILCSFAQKNYYACRISHASLYIIVQIDIIETVLCIIDHFAFQYPVEKAAVWEEQRVAWGLSGHDKKAQGLCCQRSMPVIWERAFPEISL